MNLEIFKKYPIASICAAGVLVMGGIVFMRGGVVESLQLQEDELESRRNVIKDNQRSSNGLESDVAELEEQTARLADRVFDRSDLVKNSKFFYRFEKADEFDVSVNQVTQRQDAPELFAKKGPKELKLHSVIGYDLDVEGRFIDVVDFLQELDQSEAVIRVSGFDVTHAEGEKRGIDDDLRMRLQVFALAEKGDA